MSASNPVVVASNQSAIPVSGTVSLGSTPVAVVLTGTPIAVSGTVSLGSTPVAVTVGNTPSVNAIQSGTWTVSIAGTPIAVSGTVSLGSTPVAIGGDTANAATDAGNPVKIGGVGKTANPTAVTDGQRVNSIFDKLGKQVVVGSIRDLKINQRTIITSSTAETTVLTAVASTFLDVYGVVVINSSATATNVTFKDSTSGTAQFDVYVPAGDTRGFMLPESGAVKQTSTNQNWTATSSASVASINVSMFSVKNT